MSDLAAWLDRYATAWETRDPDAAAALFTTDATYHRTPFEAIEGREAIRDYWADATASQRDVHVETSVVTDDDPAVGRFTTDFTIDDATTLDGVCLVRLDGDRCETFREWWHTQTR
jgi:SnoaL-like polyketide cyclase.